MSVQVFVMFAAFVSVIFQVFNTLYKKINPVRTIKNLKKNKKEEKDWELWTEETMHEDKDVNKWYYILGKNVGRYKGEWKNGVANGKGIKEYLGSSDVSHSIIECNFVDGYADGYGFQTYDKTECHEEFAPYYEGEFKNGFQHGFGTYYYGDGCYRRGNLVKGKYTGFGVYYDSKKNRTWVGTYEDDVRNMDNGEWVDGKLSWDEAYEKYSTVYTNKTN